MLPGCCAVLAAEPGLGSSWDSEQIPFSWMASLPAVRLLWVLKAAVGVSLHGTARQKSSGELQLAQDQSWAGPGRLVLELPPVPQPKAALEMQGCCKGGTPKEQNTASQGSTEHPGAFQTWAGFGLWRQENSSAFSRQSGRALCSFMREVSLLSSAKESSKKIMHVAKSQPGEQLEEK